MHRCHSAESKQQHHHKRQAQNRAAQIVEYLPSAYGVHLVFHNLPAFVAHLVPQPAYNLPVAASPTVVAFGVINIVGWVVVKQLYIVYQSAAYMASLYQVVAQYQVFWECTFQHLLEYL